MKTTTNLIIISLASLDIVACSVQLPILIKFHIIDVNTLMKRDPWFNDWSWVLYYLFFVNISLLSQNTSVWLGAGLAVFRYCIVRHCMISSVMRYRSTLQKRRALIIIFTSLISNAILIIPYLFTQTIKQRSVRNDTFNTTNYLVSQYQASRHKEMKIFDIYSSWMGSILNKIIPSVIIVVFVGALLHSMALNEERKHSLVFENLSFTKRTRKNRVNHHRTTRLLIVIVIIIFLAEIPHAIMQFLSRFHHYSYCVYLYLGDFIDFLTLCKNGITFVLYCFMSSDFRKIFTHYYLKYQCIHYYDMTWSKDDLEQQSSVNDLCTSIHHHLQAIPIHIRKSKVIKISKISRKTNIHVVANYQNIPDNHFIK